MPSQLPKGAAKMPRPVLASASIFNETSSGAPTRASYPRLWAPQALDPLATISHHLLAVAAQALV